ncbi:MAG: PIG-L deacetylase family protein [Candidatus Promineifilaceae bacterium]
MSKTYIPPRSMFIFAHPDDIEFSAGGTAALWAKEGGEVIYVMVTDGNVGSHEEDMTEERLIQTRREEQQAAADVAGVKECVFLGYHDGLVEATLALRQELVRLIRKHKPNVVVCTDPTAVFVSDDYINHPDHRAVAKAAIEAVFPASEMHLLYPEMEAEGLTPHKANYVYVTHSGSAANYFVDVTEVMDIRLEALKQHKSQFGEWDPTEMVQRWNSETGKKVGFKYAEAYRRITLKEPEEEGNNN